MPIKFYMFLPTSCKALEDNDFKKEEDLQVTAAHAGTVARNYSVHMYSVCDDGGQVNKGVYF